MKYGLYDVTYDPEEPSVFGEDHHESVDLWAQHCACCTSVILILAAQRDNGDDIGLLALERLAARFSPTHAGKLAQAIRTELTKAHAWIAATQVERAQRRTAEARVASHKQRDGDGAAQGKYAPVNGVPLANESIARRLESTGAVGRERAEELRESSRKRMRQYQAGKTQVSDALATWIPDEAGEAPVLVAIAEALWNDRIERTKPLRVEDYSKVSKYAGGFAPWASGAPALELDGSRFKITANTPARVFGPRALVLLPDGLDFGRAHSAILPLDYDRDTNPEAQLALAMVNPAQVALNPAGSKIALLALGNPHVLSGGISTATAKEWATLIHSGQRYQGYMLKTTAAGMTSLRSIMLYLPDGTRMQMFSIRDVCDPEKVKPGMEFGIALDRQFQEVVWEAFRGKGTSWCGSFLLDVTGAMTIPMNRPELLRLHVRASVRANAAFSYGKGVFDHQKLEYETLTEIAARINSIDSETAELLATNGKLPRSAGWTRVKASERRKKLRESMENLEGRGLWTVDRQGRDRFRLLPTEKYLEAWSAIRTKGQKR